MPVSTTVADAAGELIKNPAFKAACERVEEQYTEQWRGSELSQGVEREAAYRQLRALVDLLRALRGFYETGEAEKIAASRKARAAGQDL